MKETNGLLIIIIVILIVVFFPGLIWLIIGATGMVAHSLIAILPLALLGVAFIALCIYAAVRWDNGFEEMMSGEHAKLPPLIKEMGFEPDVTLSFYKACVKEGILQIPGDRVQEMARQVAENNTEFKFALKDDVYWKMYSAVSLARDRMIREKSYQKSITTIIKEKAQRAFTNKK